MQTEALRNLVAKIKHLQCEMQTVELKAANKGCPTRLYDTLSSFANQDEGGVIVFGIDERIFSEGKAEGRAEGRAEGEVSANYAAAKRMLLKGNNSLQDIAEFTNLPLSKIQELQAELKNA